MTTFYKIIPLGIRKFVRRILNNLLSDEKFIKKQYMLIFGHKLDLKNPLSLNQKIQWLKLYDRTELHTICADKIKVRDYVKEKIGAEYLIPILFQTENLAELNFHSLPKKDFILKTNHDSGTTIIVRDSTTMDINFVQQKLKKALQKNFYWNSREWQYKNIKPRKVLVEQLLLDENKKIPNDYKLHCFNGKVKFIQVDMDRKNNHKRNLYDPDWNLINCQWFYPNGVSIKKPETLDLMKNLAEKLSLPFKYARIDLYQIERKIYFGEITFHPESGFKKFISDDFDYKFGELLQL